MAAPPDRPRPGPRRKAPSSPVPHSEYPLLSVEDVAGLAGMPPDTVRRKINRGELQGYKGGNRTRVAPEHFDAFVFAAPIAPKERASPALGPPGRSHRARPTPR